MLLMLAALMLAAAVSAAMVATGAHHFTDAAAGAAIGTGLVLACMLILELVTFLLASREESGAPIDVYSPRSPLGAAIMGKKVGEKATYSLPNGQANTVEILEAVPYVGAEV